MTPVVAANEASLITPELGLSIWTLVTFLIVLFVLRKFAFGRIAALLDERREAVRQNLEAAEHAREEAERLLEEYKTQLAQSKREANEILGGRLEALDGVWTGTSARWRVRCTAIPYGLKHTKNGYQIRGSFEGLRYRGGASDHLPLRMEVVRN